jgi:MFS family permease
MATKLPDDGASPAGFAPLSAGFRRYALGLLFVIYVLNFVDRQIVNILAESIRKELHLRDWQIGALTGLSFALFYTILGLPIARLAERGDRPRIIAAAVVVWSAFTALCGFAHTFMQFALARVGVGVGEAGCTPPAHSLISDYVPKSKRASALAFYSMGGPVGALVGMAVGGLVADLWGWRAAFLVVAGPGLLLGAITALTLNEPRRAAQWKGLTGPSPSLREAIRELRTCRTYWLFVGASTMMAIVSYGHGSFLASFFLRNHGAGLAKMAAAFNLQPTGFLGLAVGLITGIGGILGALFGGWLADRLATRSGPKGYATLAAAAAFLSVPPYIAAMLAPTAAWALGLLFLPYVFFNMSLGPMYAVPQSVVHPRTRATATAVLFFCTNLVGLGLGPLTVGAFSDSLQASGMSDGQAIRMAQVATTLVGVIAAWLYWRARKYIEADIVS